MISISGRNVVMNERVLLSAGDDRVEFEGEHGLKVLITFKVDGTGKPSVSPEFRDGTYRLPLSNFGGALGMAVSGAMTAHTSSGHSRPGVWQLRYALAVHSIGEDYRSVQLTITEERVA